MKKRVCVTISSRANYSSLISVLEAAKADEEIELQIVCYASANLARYGNVAKYIKEDGFEISRSISSHLEGDDPIFMAKSAGVGLMEFSGVFAELDPDVIIVVGDRYEIIAPVVAAAYMNIPIAHTMGGEVTGTIDESIRHAVTKFSHLHFVASEDAYKRVIRLGEIKNRVFNYGCPRIDTVSKIIENIDTKKLQIYLNNHGTGPAKVQIDKPFLLVSHHSVTSDYLNMANNMQACLKAVKQTNLPAIFLWPNPDSGSERISKEIRMFSNENSNGCYSFYNNLTVNIYSSLMKLTTCLVGNSSSGIREGAFIGTPVVNIGSRQKSRERSDNVIDVNADYESILDAINIQIKKGHYVSSHIYGDGNTGGRIISEIKKQIPINTQKIIAY